MKKYIFASAVIISMLLVSVNASADGCARWYIKRRGNDTPIFPSEANEVSEHGGYFIDLTAAEKQEKVLYLTFDAGYENGNISKILDVLKEKEVCSAFFLLDNIILKNTDLVKRMTDEGHLVCNHTRNHKNLSSADENEIKENLASLERIYTECTGAQMSKYFRFPEGAYSIDAIKAVDKLGYKTVFWSFAYEDWDNCRQMSEERAIRKILDNTHPGAIILLHPTSSTNANIMTDLIDAWRQMGYSFGSLDDLCR